MKSAEWRGEPSRLKTAKAGEIRGRRHCSHCNNTVARFETYWAGTEEYFRGLDLGT